MSRIKVTICLIFIAIGLIGLQSAVSQSQQKTEFEIATFTGGYHQLKVTKMIAQEYQKEHPNIDFKIWGGPRVWEKVRPRFVAGNPPDLVAPGWGFDVWSAIYKDQVMPLDQALESPAYHQDIKWKDRFLEGVLTPYFYDGHYWIVPQFLNVEGWWYDANFFKKKGWEVPETWNETLQLAKEIKNEGIAPFTNQGMYPGYAVRHWFIALAVKIGGLQAYEDAVNLKPGAWNSSAFLQAAKAIKELVDKGYFQKGHLGMSHTASQMQVLLHKAAIIGCGSWLESEMSKQMPPGVQLKMMKVPAFPKGQAEYLSQQVDGDPATVWIIPKKSDHPDIAIDFLKFMTSPEMVKKTIQEIEKGAAYLPFKGSKQWITSKAVLSAAEAVEEAEVLYDYRDTVKSWYPSLHDTLKAGIQKLFAGEITPKEYVDSVEKRAEEIRENPNIVKHKYSIQYPE